VTRFIPLQEFTDADLHNDYFYLENVIKYVGEKKQATSNKYMTNRFKILQKGAFQRQIRLKVMPPHFSRHRLNTSFFNIKANTFEWRIEWIFSAVGIHLIDERVKDTETLKNALSTQLRRIRDDPEKIEKMSSFLDLPQDSLLLFLAVPKLKAQDQAWFQLSQSATLLTTLKGKEVLEFPEIHVCLPSQIDGYPLFTSFSITPNLESTPFPSPFPSKSSDLEASDESRPSTLKEPQTEIDSDFAQALNVLSSAVWADFQT